MPDLGAFFRQVKPYPTRREDELLTSFDFAFLPLPFHLFTSFPAPLSSPRHKALLVYITSLSVYTSSCAPTVRVYPHQQAKSAPRAYIPPAYFTVRAHPLQTDLDTRPVHQLDSGSRRLSTPSAQHPAFSRSLFPNITGNMQTAFFPQFNQQSIPSGSSFQSKLKRQSWTQEDFQYEHAHAAAKVSPVPLASTPSTALHCSLPDQSCIPSLLRKGQFEGGRKRGKLSPTMRRTGAGSHHSIASAI